MKKIFSALFALILGVSLSIGFTSASSSDCLNIKFDNGDSVCLDITKNGSKTFKLSIDRSNISRPSSLTCRITLPNSYIYFLNGCNGTFTYRGTNTRQIRLSVSYTDKNNRTYYNWISTNVNFSNGSRQDNTRTLNSGEGSRNRNTNTSTRSNSTSTRSNNSSSNSNNEIELSTNRKSPSTNQYVNLTITTDDDYVGKLSFSAKYRNSSSSSWSSISTLTSYTYFSDYSDEWDDGYYKMKSSDDGEVTLKNLVKFRKSGYYRIYVTDANGNESYIQFSVGDVDDEDDNRNSELKISASPTDLDINEWMKMVIKTDDDYTSKVTFSKLQYRFSSSSSWSDISRTSSTYISDYSNEWDDGYYRMKSSDDGEVTLKNLVKFRKSGYYRIYVTDIYGNESYVQVSVDISNSSSNSNDEIELSTNRKSPSTNQYVNLTITTDDDYVGKLSFSAKYRNSSSSSWSSISTLTSYTYFSDYSDEWDDGYYKMKSSDDGEVTLKNLVKFRKSGYYRIYVTDANGNESYIQFSVGDVDDEGSSNVSGFSSSELKKVKSIYNQWNDLIEQLKKKYSSLKKDYFWRTMSENFYDDMKDIINNKRPRNLSNYDDFKDAFDDWYDYTMDRI